MKFNIHVTYRDEPGEPWVEDYNRPEIKTEGQAREWASRLIENFNNTLRPHEHARRVVAVSFEDNNAVKAHEWHKTNLVTLFNGRSLYDALVCLVCGVTAKRHGLDRIVLDPKYRKNSKYASCDWKK